MTRKACRSRTSRSGRTASSHRQIMEGSALVSDLPELCPGDLVFVDGHTSVQFGPHPFAAVIIPLMTELPSYCDGWATYRVYQLSGGGSLARIARNIFIQPDKVIRLWTANSTYE